MAPEAEVVEVMVTLVLQEVVGAEVQSLSPHPVSLICRETSMQGVEILALAELGVVVVFELLPQALSDLDPLPQPEAIVTMGPQVSDVYDSILFRTILVET